MTTEVRYLLQIITLLERIETRLQNVENHLNQTFIDGKVDVKICDGWVDCSGGKS